MFHESFTKVDAISRTKKEHPADKENYRIIYKETYEMELNDAALVFDIEILIYKSFRAAYSKKLKRAVTQTFPHKISIGKRPF